MARATNGEDLASLALPTTEPYSLPFHAIGRAIAPYYLAWYKFKDRREYKN